MKQAKLTRPIAFALAFVFLFGSFSAVNVSAASEDGESSGDTSAVNETSTAEDVGADGETAFGYSRTKEELEKILDANSYQFYSKKYADVPLATESITVPAVDYDPDATTAQTKVLTDFDGQEGDSLLMGSSGNVTWKFYVEKTGMYSMRLNYYPYDSASNDAADPFRGTSTTIERILYIDGEIPFSDARYLYFPRIWSYVLEEDGSFAKDINGNDIRPVREETPRWDVYYVRDWLGFEIDPFRFYLSEGWHTITFEASREPMLLNYIEFYRFEEEKPYDEVLQQWLDEGKEIVSSSEVSLNVEDVRVQAENPDVISIAMMFPANDRTSALSEPQDPAVIKYNILDVNTVNQYARYKVNVPKSGLYKISVRFRQNGLIGLFSSRRIRVNGEVQFREASFCRFMYDTGFQVTPLNDGEHDYFLFYLEEGENEIEFEVVLGELYQFVNDIKTTIADLEEAYSTLLMITGATPDSSRDYGFSRLCPEVLNTLAKSAVTLHDISDRIVEMTGETGDQQQALEMYAQLFETMAKDEYTIADNFVTLKNYTISLSNWLYTALTQPLKMDYFQVQCADEELPQALPNFLQAAWFEIRAFVMSFYMDYTTIGFASDAKDSDANLTLWATGTREDSLILRRLIDTYFTPESDISVTIKVITAGLQEAILAGIGPDVSNMTSTDTMTWGLRTAVEPLNDFEGFDEVMTWFPQAALTPLTLNGVTYGLPTTMTFSMMFYRVDILYDLGIEIPDTWDDLYDIINILQNKHLELGMFANNAEGTEVFLYQMGETLFKDNGYRINLDNNTVLSAFETFTDFYIKYSCDIGWDVTRFRTGELPIIFADAITTYNTLMGCYELRGLWEMAPLLGTVQEDGSINSTAIAAVTAIIIPRGANKEASWEYLKWYCSEDAQKRLVKETIMISQPTTKVSTTNINAMLSQPWTVYEKAAISDQLNNLAGIEEYPGIYIVPTYIDYAFKDVYNNRRDASTAMLERIIYINNEISRKRAEFGMETYEEQQAALESGS